MEKKTFLYGYASLSLIIDRVERENREFEEACSVAVRRITKYYFLSLVQKALGKGVVFYNRKDVLDWALEEQNKGVLKKICEVAADEERTDLLDGVWNNVEDDEGKMISRALYSPAARHGKLNVLKWLETKGLFVNNDYCAKLSAYGGHIHILKWLREEKGLESNDGELYGKAIKGGHLHVLKWLREQEVDWDDYTFHYAAQKGNLEILQWLHDEGCPWPEDDDLRVFEDEVKPEVIDWCRMNGYRDRIEYLF